MQRTEGKTVVILCKPGPLDSVSFYQRESMSGLLGSRQ